MNSPELPALLGADGDTALGEMPLLAFPQRAQADVDELMPTIRPCGDSQLFLSAFSRLRDHPIVRRCLDVSLLVGVIQLMTLAS
jgi:hypothetical protein